jgi:hypothetical protein
LIWKKYFFENFIISENNNIISVELAQGTRVLFSMGFRNLDPPPPPPPLYDQTGGLFVFLIFFQRLFWKSQPLYDQTGGVLMVRFEQLGANFEHFWPKLCL